MVNRGHISSLLACALWVAVLAGFFATSSWAQGTGGRVRGRTSDESGAVIPAAEVVLVNTETNQQRTATTDAGGSYLISNVPPGAYRLQVSLPGFQTTTQSFVLTLGQDLELNPTMKVGAVTETVQVTAETVGVQSRNAEISGNVSTTQVRDLPLAQRDFRDLTSLLPGVAPMPASNTQAGGSANTRQLRISVGGGRISATSYFFDGVYLNSREGYPPQGITGSLIGIDAIREFRVLTNSYSARYGRGGSGVVNVVSRGGTNGLHGTVFEYLRNNFFDARNFFATKATVPVQPPLRRNDFGFTLGGPIRKDKTFFFGNWEGLRQSDGRTQVVRVPDADARRGVLPGGTCGSPKCPVTNVIGTQVSNAILNLYPLPNGTSFPDGTANFTTAFSSRTRDDVANFRIDHKLSDNHSLFGRYTFNDGRRTDPAAIPVFTSLSTQRSQWLTIQEDWIVTPAIVNTLRAGYTRLVNANINGGADVDPILVMPGRFNAPTITIAPLATFTPTQFTPALPTTNNSYQLSDDVMYTIGRHNLTFGFRAERFQTITQFQFSKDGISSAGSGTWTFDSLPLFFANRARLIRDSVGRPTAPLLGNGRTIEQTYYGGYIEDEFQLLSNLTVTAGLRVEHMSPANRDPNPYKLVNLLTDTLPTQVENLYTTSPVLGPRIGVAWQPFNSEKFVVRSGFGMFYDQFGAGFYNLPMGNFPYTFSTSVGNAATGPVVFPFPNPYVSGFIPGPESGSTFTTRNTYDVPTIIQYNLSLTSVLPKQVELTVAYAGNQSTHLSTGKNINPPANYVCSTATPCFLGGNVAPQLNGRRFFDTTKPKLNPNYPADIVLRDADGKAYYHSLQVSANQRFTSGLNWQMAYTFSKCIDLGSAENTGDFGGVSDQYVLDIFDMSTNRGLCNQDIRSRFVTNLSYTLPFRASGFLGALVNGWATTGIFQTQNGSPFGPKLTVPRSGSWLGASNSRMERPDFAPGRSVDGIILGGPDKYYDPTAFVLQPAGFYGNVGRNIITGPGLVNLDLAVSRTFPLPREGMNIQFRAESFNTVNRPNFGVPNWQVFTNTTGVRNPSAGQITDTSTPPRQFQFSLKFLF